jgi:5'-methylthioadenosine phosphorylase/purine-nucleoside phosphorylase
MLGYSGEWEGKPVSVQSTGMGCPSAAIVMEELVQLGVTRFLRVGTCGGLSRTSSSAT